MGGSGKVKIPQSPLEAVEAENLKNYSDKFGKPALEQVGPQVLGGFASNDIFSKEPDAYARDTLEKQFQQAGAQNLNDAPVRGGRLARSMTQLNSDRASGISGLYAQKGQEARGMLANMLPAIFPSAASNQQAGINLAGQQNQRNQLAAQMTQQNQGAMGQGIGGLLGSLGGGIFSMFSSRTLKDGVEPYEDDVLAQLDATPVYKWRYIGEDREHIGPVTEEAPRIIVSDDGMALVPVDYLGFMFAALKALNAKVEALR